MDNESILYYQLLSYQIPIISIAITVFAYIHQNLKNRLGEVPPRLLLHQKTVVVLLGLFAITTILSIFSIAFDTNRLQLFIVLLFLLELASLGYSIYNWFGLVGDLSLLRKLEKQITIENILCWNPKNPNKNCHNDGRNKWEQIFPSCIFRCLEQNKSFISKDNNLNTLGSIVTISIYSLDRMDYFLWNSAISAICGKIQELLNDPENSHRWDQQKKITKQIIHHMNILAESARNRNADLFWFQAIEQMGRLGKFYAEKSRERGIAPNGAIPIVSFLQNQAYYGLRKDVPLAFSKSLYWLTKIGVEYIEDNNLSNRIFRSLGWCGERLVIQWDGTSTYFRKDNTGHDDDSEDRFAAMEYGFQELCRAISSKPQAIMAGNDFIEAGKTYVKRLFDPRFSEMANLGDQEVDFEGYVNRIIDCMMTVTGLEIQSSIEKNELSIDYAGDFKELYDLCPVSRGSIRQNLSEGLLRIWALLAGWLVINPDSSIYLKFELGKWR